MCFLVKTPFLDHLSPRRSSRARATLSVLLLVQDTHPGLNVFWDMEDTAWDVHSLQSYFVLYCIVLYCIVLPSDLVSSSHVLPIVGICGHMPGNETVRILNISK